MLVGLYVWSLRLLADQMVALEYIEDAPLLRKTILENYPPIKDMCWAYNAENDHLFTKEIKCGLQEDLII